MDGLYIAEWDWRDSDVEHLAAHGCNLLTCWPSGGKNLGIDGTARIVEHHIRWLAQTAAVASSRSSYAKMTLREAGGARSQVALRPQRSGTGGKETDVGERERSADDVLEHSEDEGEWEQEPEEIESRPSGSQVISARLPTSLAEQVLAEAARRGAKPSEVVREAIEIWLRAVPGGMAEISAYAGQNMRILTPSVQGKTENFNLVVGVEADPDRIEVVEALA